MRTGSVVVPGPIRNTDTMMLLNEIAKAKTPPATRLGLITGRVTVKNVRHGRAPSVAAASSRVVSYAANAAYIARTPYGSATTACPTTRLAFVGVMPSFA